MPACTYCGADADAHDPLRLDDPETGETLGYFCNYACLSAHVDEENLTAGDACEWAPGEDCC